MLKTKAFWAVFGALVFTTISFKFFPDPYSKDGLKELGLSNEEIYKRFALYTGIGLVLLFFTTIIFFHAIESTKIGS